MSDPAYQPIKGTSFYEIPAADAAGWSGYLLPANEQAGESPLSLTDAFAGAAQGHYLFCASRPAQLNTDATALADALYQSFEDQEGGFPTNGRALAWLELDIAGTFKGLALFDWFQGPSPDKFKTHGQTAIFFSADFLFFLDPNLDLGFSATDSALTLFSDGLERMGFRYSGSGDLGLQMPKQSANLHLTGPYAGCLTTAITVDQRRTQQAFSTGLQYGYPDDDKPQDRQIHHYMLFEDGAAMFPSVGTIDPLDPLNENAAPEALASGTVRTGFFFTDARAMASTLRTTDGKAITLYPVPGGLTPHAGGLTFSASQPEPIVGISTLQLTPVGSYTLGVDGVANATPDQRLLPGLFGSEFITFATRNTDGEGDQLRWRPAQPAFAAKFPFAAATLTNPDSGAVGERLDTSLRTSWATMIAGPNESKTVSISAQPAGAALYAISPEGGTILPGAPPMGALPDQPVPVVPYSAFEAGEGGNVLGEFESQILSPTRKAKLSPHARKAMTAHKAAMASGEITSLTRLATTPQGLLAEVPLDAQGMYTKVTLAKPAEPLAPDFAFCNLTETLTDAFQTNQLFLVAVNDAALGAPVTWQNGDDAPLCTDGGPAQFLNALDIADWTFVANVGKGALPTSYRNVLIMKFCDGKLIDRLNNPNQWTAPEDFSVLPDAPEGIRPLALTGLSQWLRDYANDGIEKSKGSDETAALYRDFAKIMTDPKWQGFIVLNADLPLSALPPQIAGIGAGIDLERFVGHHFGSTVSRVIPKDGTLQIDGASSLFGLIDYVDPAYQSALASGASPNAPVRLDTKDGYAFAVLQLQVQFAQAKLKVFRSRIQQSLEHLFQSPVTSTSFDGQNQAVPAVVLEGSAVTQGTEVVYVFEQNKPYLFVTDTPALNAIAISRTQFNTLNTDADGIVNSRFLMWGALDMALLKTKSGTPFDILSFGSEPDAPDDLGLGLHFSNLQISMSFPEAVPADVTFAFLPENMAFDIGASETRKTTLFDGFSLQLTGFISAPDGKVPADYGYLPVQPDDVALARLDGPWYGISYKIDMGSPGALVSGAGFSSSMVTAWSPAGKRGSPPQVFTGLSLPGAAPAASAFSLQGVIKLSTGPIGLGFSTTTDGGTYTLRLENIGIKVLGIAKLPPAATIQFFLFGDPNGSGSLGWWASYIQDDAQKESLAEIDTSEAAQ